MKKLTLTAAFLVVGLTNNSCKTTQDLASDTPLKSSLQFDNSLSQCIVIKDYTTQRIDNTTLLTLKYEHKQSIASCGCKSALSQYAASSPYQEFAYGLISFLDFNGSHLTVTLSNSPNLLSQHPITLSLGCAQPL